MKAALIVALVLSLTGCGKLDRLWAAYTGDAAETCMHGVLYYQFTSGAAPAYRPDGTLITCK